MSHELIQPTWMRDIAKRLVADLEQQAALWERIEAERIRHSLTIDLEVPRAPEWLERRSAFVERWRQLTTEGIEQEFLEREACYECAGRIRPTTATVTWEEAPNPDYVPPTRPDDTP